MIEQSNCVLYVQECLRNYNPTAHCELLKETILHGRVKLRQAAMRPADHVKLPRPNPLPSPYLPGSMLVM